MMYISHCAVNAATAINTRQKTSHSWAKQFRTFESLRVLNER